MSSLRNHPSQPVVGLRAATIEALAPTMAHLYDLASGLDTEIVYNFYLTDPPTANLPAPAVLPNSTSLSPYRPEVSQLVREALPQPPVTLGTNEKTASHGGGLAVIAAGPEGLVMEARNAVAGLSVAARVRAGGVSFHDEVYCL